MRTFIAGHEARSAEEFIELAIGTPLELWLGVDGETDQERAAREDAARDILADDPELFDRVSRVVAEAVEALAPEIFGVCPLHRPQACCRTARRAAA